jgi:hypothetical protein
MLMGAQHLSGDPNALHPDSNLMLCLRRCDCCAFAAANGYAGATTKPLTHSNSSANITDQQQLETLTATPAAVNSSLSTNSSSSRDTGGGSSTEAAAAAAAVLQHEVGRLRQEVSCLRTTLGTLYVTCAHLKEVRFNSDDVYK